MQVWSDGIETRHFAFFSISTGQLRRGNVVTSFVEGADANCDADVGG